MIETVTSTRNQRVVAAARLHRTADRQDRGLTIIEGPHLLEAAMAGGAVIRDVFCLPDDTVTLSRSRDMSLVPVVVNEAVLARLAGTEAPRGPVAVMVVPDDVVVERDAVVLHVDDPGNAGTLIRTAAAFGMDVVISAGTDPWSPKVLRSAAGAHFSTRIGRSIPPGWLTIATVPRHGTDLANLSSSLDPARRWAVLIGSEAHGLAPPVIEDADIRVTIPMDGGFESLNAAIAGSIVMFELALIRRVSSLGVANLPPS